MDFDQKLLLLQSQLSRRYVYTASVTSGETSSLATGLPAKPQETITRIQFNIYINQSNLLGSLHSVAWGERTPIGRASNEGHSCLAKTRLVIVQVLSYICRLKPIYHECCHCHLSFEEEYRKHLLNAGIEWNDYRLT